MIKNIKTIDIERIKRERPDLLETAKEVQSIYINGTLWINDTYDKGRTKKFILPNTPNQ